MFEKTQYSVVFLLCFSENLLDVGKEIAIVRKFVSTYVNY